MVIGYISVWQSHNDNKYIVSSKLIYGLWLLILQSHCKRVIKNILLNSMYEIIHDIFLKKNLAF